MFFNTNLRELWMLIYLGSGTTIMRSVEVLVTARKCRLERDIPYFVFPIDCDRHTTYHSSDSCMNSINWKGFTNALIILTSSSISFLGILTQSRSSILDYTKLQLSIDPKPAATPPSSLLSPFVRSK